MGEKLGGSPRGSEYKEKQKYRRKEEEKWKMIGHG
jgi:hypothetical protein